VDRYPDLFWFRDFPVVVVGAVALTHNGEANSAAVVDDRYHLTVVIGSSVGLMERCCRAVVEEGRCTSLPVVGMLWWRGKRCRSYQTKTWSVLTDSCCGVASDIGLWFVVLGGGENARSVLTHHRGPQCHKITVEPISSDCC
jgi:hypothetical protein